MLRSVKCLPHELEFRSPELMSKQTTTITETGHSGLSLYLYSRLEKGTGLQISRTLAGQPRQSVSTRLSEMLSLEKLR